MTHDEATTRCAELNSRDAERSSYRWVQRPSADGSWEVVAQLDPAGRRSPLHATIEQKPETPEPSDPRSIVERQVGGSYLGG